VEPLTARAVVEAAVTRLEPYGVWVEAVGRTGQIRIPEVSRVQISHPRDVLAVGDRVRVKVLYLQADGGFAASIRAARPEDDPWLTPSRFVVGAEFDAPVVRVLDYGCLVELWPHLWALLRRDQWPGPLVKGERLRVCVESSDPTTRTVEVRPVE
jgi:small subunit ribosomal protein S1